MEGEGALGLGPGEPWRHGVLCTLGWLIERRIPPSFAVFLLLSVAPVAVRVVEKTAIICNGTASAVAQLKLRHGERLEVKV